MGSLFDTIAGLPVHALVVHATVVLIPLGALGAILMALRSSFSRRFGSLVVIVAGVGAASAYVAKESGDKLAQRVGTPEVHSDLGHQMPIIAGVLFVIVLAFWLVDRGIPANKSRPVWLTILGVVMIVVSLFALFWTIRVGHTGAEAVWSAVIENTNPG
jgi:hypothetical protein